MPIKGDDFVYFWLGSISGGHIVIRELNFSKFLLELSVSTLDLLKFIFKRLAHLLKFSTKRVNGLKK